MTIEQVMGALVSLYLNTDLERFGLLFYDGMHKGYIKEKFRMFTANPVAWYCSLDWLTKQAVHTVLDSTINRPSINMELADVT